MVVNTAEWPIRQANIMDLYLDTKNVRLRAVEPYESDVLAYLYDQEDVLTLAKEIVQDGFFQNDMPIVTQEDGNLIVLEGNRRIAALKGLANPTSVPKFRGRLMQLRALIDNESSALLLSIRVTEAPDRESAQPILASLHTRNPKKSWPRDQQAAFYFAQLGPGVTVKDLQERYPSVASKIPQFIRLQYMYEMVKSANLGDSELQEYANSKKFKMSIFERLYASPVFRQFLGVVFEDDGNVRIIGDQANVDQVLSQVVRDMKDGVLNTRRLGTQESEGFKSYLGELDTFQCERDREISERHSERQPDSPDENDESGSEANSFHTHSSGKSDADEAELKGPSKFTLDTSGIVYGLASQGLHNRFVELQSINYTRFPNATMDLLRTVLECALKEYLDNAGDPIPPPPKGQIRLSNATAYASKHFAKKGNKQLATMIQQIQNPPQDEVQFSTSALALNAANHNPDVSFTQANVRQTWQQLRDLYRKLLTGPKHGGSDS